jgi:hypothetical protein
VAGRHFRFRRECHIVGRQAITKQRKIQRCLGLALAVALAFPTLAFGAEETKKGSLKDTSDSIELSFVNGQYRDLATDIAPIQQGPLLIRISSPEHEMTVHGNRLRMRPESGGVAMAEITVDLEGYGQLIADLEGLGGGNSFKDRVDVERQTLEVAGRVRLQRVEHGFLLTVVQLPESVQLRIQSGVGEQIVGICTSLDKLPLLSLDCAGMAEALAIAAVPLPGPGETYLLEDDRLSPEDRAFFQQMSGRLEKDKEKAEKEARLQETQ